MRFVRRADVVFVLSDSEVLVMFVTLDHENPTINISERNKIIKSQWVGLRNIY
jgi:hypothetical protein